MDKTMQNSVYQYNTFFLYKHYQPCRKSIWKSRVNWMMVCLMGLILQTTAVAGQGLYIAPGANVFVHSDSVGIFTNVSNSGNFGSKPGTVIGFMGLLWSNDTTAALPDEGSYAGNISTPTTFTGSGGLFWFNSFAASLGQPQLLTGGYLVSSRKGPSFPNLKVDNPQGIFLSGDLDLQVRNVLNFANGKLWVNGNNLMMGSAKPGLVTGYSETRYIVTGTGITGGFLYYARVDSTAGQVVFPVGADILYYTPAAITYKGVAQNFKVRPFDQIFSHAINGVNGNTLDQSFVQTTWNIGKETSDSAETDIVLQHPRLLEGTVFALKRDSSYITRYDGSRMVWDTIPASGVHQPGKLTTGTPQDSTFENVRGFIMALSPNEYLSKTVSLSVGLIAKLGLANNLDQLIAHEDGSCDVALSMVVQNQGKNDLRRVLVSNNLTNTFTSSVSIDILSLKATGSLVANAGYNGLSNGDTMLLLPTSSLATRHTDTIHLFINVNPGSLNGTFYNLAYGVALTKATGYTVTTTSVNGLNPSGPPGKTPITLRKLKVRIPGGFSPNGDGVNDKFVMDSTVNYNVAMEVFNRWGQKVYKSNGYYNNDWDGTCNQPGPFLNNKLADGTYFYFITFTDKQSGEITKAVGYITLRR
jgi:gliding motility-associated-like protein